MPQSLRNVCYKLSTKLGRFDDHNDGGSRLRGSSLNYGSVHILATQVIHFSTLRVKDLQKDYLVKYTEEKDKEIQGSGANDFWAKVTASSPNK
jgi:hypothetical protein